MDSSHLSQASQPEVDRTLAGGNEMGRLMRSINWAETPLGPVSGWSQSLRTSVSICLNSRFPILIWWGPDLIMLYNDAYRPMLGVTKHPKAMGQRGRECWPEIWHIIGPMLEGVLTRGQATWSEDQLLLLDRNGFLEECYFTFSYSPIQDENGIGGVFTAVTETTGRLVSERRMAVLADLSTHLSIAETEEQICALAIQILAQNRQDMPFAALYLLDRQERSVQLVEQTGLAQDVPTSASFLERAGEGKKEAGAGPHPLAFPGDLYIPDGSLYRALNLPPEDPGTLPVTQMEILPLGSPDSPLGYLAAGLSPYRPLDEDYHSFLTLVTGQIASALATARALEEEHKRAEALAELDRAKTEFFSNVSHEFRTPITLMLGPVQDALGEDALGEYALGEPALGEIDGGLSKTNRERLEVVYRNGLRLLKLVNTLLDFSRIEAGRMQAKFLPVDLAAMTRDLVSVFRSTIENANLKLEVNCPPLPEPLYVDPEMWEKIVLNLVSNAFKYTFEGQITISLEWKKPRVELRVTDTGTGIAPEQIPLIFERFHRVEGARSRSMEGSGIGLALVRELIWLHGGYITVTSELGKGSTFCVSLPTGYAHLPPDQVRVSQPAAPGSSGALPYVEEAKRWLLGSNLAPDSLGPLVRDQEIFAIAEDQPPQKPAFPAYILLADDNADMREYLRGLLSSRWTVEAVSDGAAALEAIRAKKPDLFLSDVMMPGLDGFDLLRKLRKDPETRDLPIIIVSARAGEEARVEGLDRGADDYLVKPFSARELLARVESCLALARMRGEMQRKITGILESMPDAFWVVDRQWWMTYRNQPAARMMPAGLQAKASFASNSGHLENLRPYFQSMLSEENWANLEAAMREQRIAVFEHYRPEADVWYEFRAYPYEAGLAIYAADITVEKMNAEVKSQVDLQRRLLENREKERQEIARDIHDGPIQTLVGAIFNAQFAREALQDEMAKTELDQIGLSLKGAVRELRQVINDLRPPALIRFGLAKTIQVNMVDFQEKHPEYQVHLELQEDGNALSEPVCLTFYRVYQEGLNNIIRHAEARQIWVRLKLEKEHAVLELQDDGKGFSLSGFVELANHGHYGLAGMKERMDTIQGELRVISAPGQGTTLRITAPLAEGKETELPET